MVCAAGSAAGYRRGGSAAGSGCAARSAGRSGPAAPAGRPGRWMGVRAAWRLISVSRLVSSCWRSCSRPPWTSTFDCCCSSDLLLAQAGRDLVRWSWRARPAAWTAPPRLADQRPSANQRPGRTDGKSRRAAGQTAHGGSSVSVIPISIPSPIMAVLPRFQQPINDRSPTPCASRSSAPACWAWRPPITWQRKGTRSLVLDRQSAPGPRDQLRQCQPADPEPFLFLGRRPARPGCC